MLLCMSFPLIAFEFEFWNVLGEFRTCWLVVGLELCCPEFWYSARAGHFALERGLQSFSTLCVWKKYCRSFFHARAELLTLERVWARTTFIALERLSEIYKILDEYILRSSGSLCARAGSALLLCLGARAAFVALERVEFLCLTLERQTLRSSVLYVYQIAKVTF